MTAKESLACWGIWQRSELSHLNYQRVRLVTEKTTGSLALTEDELMKVDKTVARIKQENLTLFNVIKWRFVYRDSYRVITKKLNKRSAKVAGKYLDMAFSLFDKLQREI